MFSYIFTLLCDKRKSWGVGWGKLCAHELHCAQARSSMVLCSAIIKRDVIQSACKEGNGLYFDRWNIWRKELKDHGRKQKSNGLRSENKCLLENDTFYVFYAPRETCWFSWYGTLLLSLSVYSGLLNFIEESSRAETIFLSLDIHGFLVQ